MRLIPHVASSNHTDLPVAELAHREGRQQQSVPDTVRRLSPLRIMAVQNARTWEENSR
jgi:hypothetical protein